MIYGWGVTSGGTVSTGSIGIGTMTPTAKFDVVGPNAPGGADYVVSRFAADVGTGDGLFVAIENTDATNRQAGLDFMSQGARRWGIGSDRFSDGGHSFFIRDWVNAFDAFFIDSNDKVGIATTTPLARLDVHGQIRSTSFTTTSGTIDFSQGNAGTTNFDCGAGTMAFRDLNDGGSYSVAVTSTGTAACNFSTTIQGSGTGTVSYRFSPTNGARTASSHTIYSIIRIGATVYISWITGF